MKRAMIWQVNPRFGIMEDPRIFFGLEEIVFQRVIRFTEEIPGKLPGDFRVRPFQCLFKFVLF